MTQPKSAILVVPGTSFESGETLLSALKATLDQARYDFFLFNLWEEGGSLEKLTIGEIQENIETAAQHIREKGHSHIIGLGKSFGAGVLLSGSTDVFSELFLISPAIAFSSSASGSITELRSVPLGEIPSIMDITIGKAELGKVSAQVTIIHGNKDRKISINNTINLCNSLANCSFIPVPNMEHSLSTDDYSKIAKLISRQT